MSLFHSKLTLAIWPLWEKCFHLHICIRYYLPFFSPVKKLDFIEWFWPYSVWWRKLPLLLESQMTSNRRFTNSQYNQPDICLNICTVKLLWAHDLWYQHIIIIFLTSEQWLVAYQTSLYIGIIFLVWILLLSSKTDTVFNKTFPQPKILMLVGMGTLKIWRIKRDLP